MKNVTSLMLLATMAPAALLANVDVNFKSQKAQKKTEAFYKTDVNDCATPVSTFDLDINNVRCKLMNGGDMWWDRGAQAARYEVPKSNPPSYTSSLNMLYAGAIWISGVDAGNNLKVAAQRYRASGDDFFAGPLNTNGETSKSTCVKWDKHFSVYGKDIETVIQAYELAGGNPLPQSSIPTDVLRWPGKGNPVLESEGYDMSSVLAPFRDANGDGIYDPTKGDYPTIYSSAYPAPDTLGAYADQMVYWVMNDAGNIHSESNGQAIGVQINSLAFAFKTTDEINNMTFYRYNITNKSSLSLQQSYISQWSDPDLGNAADDYVGCDVSRRLAFIYNADNFDEAANGVGGYGSQLPMGGIVFFEGPKDLNGKELGLTSFVYFNNEISGARRDPSSAVEYRNYMTSRWLDGTLFTEGGTGYGGTTVTNFCFPGDPSDPSKWSECNNQVNGANAKGDRRMVQTSGPFLLNTGVTQDVTIGVVFVRPPGTGVGSCPPLSLIRPAADKAQGLFNQKFRITNGPDAPTLEIRELDRELIVNLVNLPGSNNFAQGYKEVIPTASVLFPGDTSNRTKYAFQGYKLYQVTDSRVSATDLEDPDKAQLIAQVDIKDGVGKIVNFLLDQSLNLYIPVEKVPEGDGTDKGITSSFRITTDKFAQSVDQNKLVNHKTYYYTAIAYAYNNYATFDYARIDSTQAEPYKVGRKNFKVYSGIPHKPEVASSGTVLNATYGQGVEVKRIEGAGNGGNIIDLTEATIEKIVKSPAAYTDTLVYEKGKDPIKFKVTDPMKIFEANWEVRFKMSTDSVNTYSNIYDDFGVLLRVDSATLVDTLITWELLRYGANGNIEETIEAENIPYSKRKRISYGVGPATTTFDERFSRPYEQFIAGVINNERVDYGFSLTFGNPVAVYTNYSNSKDIYDFLTSSIEHVDAVNPWLLFVKDEGDKSVLNWIRSGFLPVDVSLAWEPNRYRAGITDTAYTDRKGIFDKMVNSTWAPYCLTSNFAQENTTSCLTYSSGTEKGPAFTYGPGFKWRNYQNSAGYSASQGSTDCKNSNLGHPAPQNNLDELISVDVVVTPDTSKWTRCVVFETGEQTGTNAGADIAPNGKAPRKGQIRRAFSRNKDGSIAFEFNNNGDFVEDTGRSWFPGYAINVETGERLNIAFGEASDNPEQNGADMLWNPTSSVLSPINLGGAIPQLPFFGGKHFIYVMNSRYDEGKEAQDILLNYYNVPSTTAITSTAIQELHRSLIYTSIPYLKEGIQFKQNGSVHNVPPDVVKVKLRVERPLHDFITVATGDPTLKRALPRYQFSTVGLGVKRGQTAVAKNALDLIRIVPNPYLAYSQYETTQFDTRIKIINLPNKCTVSIFSIDGTFIRRYTRAIDVNPATNAKVDISDGAALTDGDINLDSSLDWDLKNDKGVPVSSGVYIVHIKADGLGERTQKVFVGMRPPDISNF